MSRLVRIYKRLMEALPSSEIFRKGRKIYAVEGKPEQKTRKPCKRRQGRLVPEQPEDEGGDQKQDRTQEGEHQGSRARRNWIGTQKRLHATGPNMWNCKNHSKRNRITKTKSPRQTKPKSRNQATTERGKDQGAGKVAQEQGNHKEGRGNPRQPQSQGNRNKCTTLTAEQCGREYRTPIGTRVRSRCKTNPRLTDNLEGRTNQPSMEEHRTKSRQTI